jgi:Plasmid pRiA4b ORF-3-like protein
MARTWLSICVDLVEGHGEHLWPRPGRLIAAARSHTFAQLGRAIDAAFARWDTAHLHEFRLADGTRLTTPYVDWEELGPAVDDSAARLSRLGLGDRFLYVFDFGDDWTHLCTVGPERIDPLETLGMVPAEPLPFFGWGDIPDQYRRRWDGDDGESRPPEDPGLADLPPLRLRWGDPNGEPD